MMELSRRQALVIGGSLLSVSSQLVHAEPGTTGGQVFLLGDSILDNKPYVGDGLAVIDQVRLQLPKGWRATLYAQDGAVVEDVEQQRDAMLPPGSHVFVSAGGNDALQVSGILNKQVRSSADVFNELAEISRKFLQRYEKMVKTIVALGGHTTLCTIYDPNFDDPQLQRCAKAALTVFNDCIVRTAVLQGLPLIDLRTVFNQRADYANAIEHSPVGGMKIAKLVRHIVTEHDFKNGGSRLYH